MLVEAITRAYKGRENKVALKIDHRQWSFKQLYQAVCDQEQRFIQAGLQSGDTLVAVLPNGWHSVLVLLTAAKMQLTIAPLPMSCTAQAFKTACQRISATAAVLWRPLKGELVADGNELFYLYAYSDDESINQAITSIAPVLLAREQINQSDLISEDAPFILTMTSGSTGDPKPIALSQRTKYLRAWSAINLYGVTENDTTLIATPLYHSLAQRLLLVSLLSAGTLVLLPKYTQEQWLRTIGQERVTFTIAVSSQLKPLINTQYSKSELANKLASLRVLVSSSALIEQSVKQQLLNVLQCEFHECYGASEVAVVTNIKFSKQSPVGSVGKPIDGVTVKVCDDTGNSVAANTVGEICVKSPLVFSGYYQLPDKTQASFKNNYFKTGDLGYFDEQGYLYFSGRKKEIIITGGINVYPEDVEQAINGLDSVIEAAAFPMPDEQLGEIVAVAVVLTSGEAANSTALSMALIDQLADFQLPRQWFFVDELPKSALGKLQRYRLAEYYLTKQQDNINQFKNSNLGDQNNRNIVKQVSNDG